jgi:hypothetical protein
MRSWRFSSFFPPPAPVAPARRRDEEDEVALVPPSPPAAQEAEVEAPGQHVPAPACRQDEAAAGTAAAVERSRPQHTTGLQLRPTSSAASKTRMRVPTWGAVVVGLALSGLTLLLLALVGTATGSWIQRYDAAVRKD